MAVTETAKAIIDIDGQLATEKMVMLKKESRDLKREITKLYQAENIDVKALAAKEQQLAKVNREQKNLYNKTLNTNRSLRNMNDHVKNNVLSLDGFKKLLPTLGIGAAIGLVAKLGKSFLDLAIQVEGENQRANIVFGDSMEEVADKTAEFADKLGVTDRKAAALAATTGDMLIPLGFTRDLAADMSTDVLELAGALDEWTQGKWGLEGAIDAVNAGLTGEMDQLKKYGIVIRQDSDEFKNMVDILIKTKGVTEDQAKAMATLELITRKSTDAQTAFNTEGNKLFRLQKSMRRRWDELRESVVDFFKIDAAKQINRQKDAFNALAVAASSYDMGTDERIDKLGQMQKIYPGFLANMDLEKVTNKEIYDELSMVNQEYTQKIALAGLDNDQKKAAAKYSKEKAKYEQDEADIAKEILQMYEALVPRVEEYNEQITGENLDFSKFEDAVGLQERYIELFKISGTVSKAFNDTFEQFDYETYLDNKFADLNAQKDLVDARKADIDEIERQIDIMHELLGANQAVQEQEPLQIIPLLPGASIEEEHKQMYDNLLALEQQYFDELALDENHWQIDREKSRIAAIDNYEQEKKELLLEYQELTLEELREKELYALQDLYAEGLILYTDNEAMKLELQEQFKFAESQVNEKYRQLEAERDKQAFDKKIQDAQNTLSKMEGAQKIYSDAVNSFKDAELDKAKFNYEQDLAYLQYSFEAGEISKEEYENKKVELEEEYAEKSKDVQKKYADAEFVMRLAGIVADVAAGIMDVVSVHAANPVAAALLSAGVIATGVAQTVVANRERKRVAQLVYGKYDVTGATDNKLYTNVPFVGPINETGYWSTPTLFAESGGEMVLSHPHVENLRINYPEIIDAIWATRVPQRQEGTPPPTAGQTQTQPPTYSQLLHMLAANMQVLQSLNETLSGGIAAYIPYQHLTETQELLGGIETENSI